MAKITRRVRVAAMLAGVSLAVSSGLTGGGLALAAGRATGTPGPRAGSPAAFAQFLPRKVPKPGQSSVLNGVFCTSSGNCWAVGTYTPSAGNGGRNEVLHWNGRKWSQFAVANPGGIGNDHFSELYAVRCTSARNCWTVGYYSRGQADLSEALHWNGRKWSNVPTPSPGGILNGDINELFDVVCTSSASCWAGGEYGNEGAPFETVLNEVLHWNGRGWSLVHVPNPAGTGHSSVQAIDAIRCTSARNCLAVGTYGNIRTLKLLNEALHWNGHKWSKLTTPNPGGKAAKGDVSELASLGCATASNCWAAGIYGNFGTQTFLNEILHWNGKKWSKQTTPDPDGTGAGASNQLVFVSCTSARSCWAVGDYGSISGGTGTILNEALRWNGKKWSLVATPNPAGTANEDQDELFGVRCTSGSNCWAVGEQEESGGSDLNQALRWKGTKWSTG